ncbi:hypothetical protein HER32_01975 [Hymenobacter sp. BT18]|uniref:hypothetical protein n=1 Tax=Hymenobacter sp. BT18 TaxID=2835648 RepID=UPI00143E6B91|nr:hypothetical protein [Hymenobacter sp. BT18]QIX60022.1 hypothetical protein HER32_01975 [Hymenobacter sp. BT18]
MLGLDGRIQKLTEGNWAGGNEADCGVAQAVNGATILTCQELILPNGRRMNLQKKNAELVAAFFLSDSTLFVAYDYVTHQLVKLEEGGQGIEEVREPRLQRTANAQVLDLTGKPLAAFRYDGFSNELGYLVPRRYVWQTSTYYLLDEARNSVHLISQQHPENPQELKLSQLEKFQAPRRPLERAIKLYGSSGQAHLLYVDTRTGRIRYQLSS